MKVFEDESENIVVRANDIRIGENVSFGKNIDINVLGTFSIGDRSRLGNDTSIEGNNIIIGQDLFHSQGLRIGGGGRLHPRANLRVGDRCTIHDSFINVCEEVVIGDDVGLSPETAILTHGYWLSVLEGFPAAFKGVNIGSGSIIGYRSLIMMGVNIGERCVVGANSVVTKDLDSDSIYAGNPAKFVRRIVPLNENERRMKVEHVVSEYREIALHHKIHPTIRLDYPLITINECVFDVEKLTFSGKEDYETDDFRDYLRKWGLRFYSKRPFKSAVDHHLQDRPAPSS